MSVGVVIVASEVVRDDVAVGDVGAERELDGDGLAVARAVLLAAARRGRRGRGCRAASGFGDGRGERRRRRRGRAGCRSCAAMRLPTLRPASTQRAKRTSMPGTAARSRSRPLDVAAPRLRREDLGAVLGMLDASGVGPRSARGRRRRRRRRAGARAVVGDEGERARRRGRGHRVDGWCRSGRRRSCRRRRARTRSVAGSGLGQRRAGAAFSSAKHVGDRALRDIGMRRCVRDRVEEGRAARGCRCSMS